MNSRFKRCFIVAFVIGCIITTSTYAAGLQIAPFYGYRFGGSLTNAQTGESLEVDAAPSVGATMSVPLPKRGEFIEFLYSYQDSELNQRLQNATIGVRTEEWQLGLNREFPSDDDRLKPFLVGLLGVTNIDFSHNLGSESLFSMGLGGGIKYFPAKNVALRLDVRGFVSFTDGSGGIACSGGCVASYHGSTFLQGEVAPSLLIQF